MCLSMSCVRVKKNIKKACLFSALSLQLFMVLMAGLDCRLWTAFSLWLGFIIARPTC